jgi:hypothetical protein
MAESDPAKRDANAKDASAKGDGEGEDVADGATGPEGLELTNVDGCLELTHKDPGFACDDKVWFCAQLPKTVLTPIVIPRLRIHVHGFVWPHPLMSFAKGEDLPHKRERFGITGVLLDWRRQPRHADSIVGTLYQESPISARSDQVCSHGPEASPFV